MYDTGNQPGRSRSFVSGPLIEFKDDRGRLGIAQETLRRRARTSLRRIIAPVDGMGRVTLSYICPHCNSFPLDDCIWWYPRDTETAATERRYIATGGVRLVQDQHEWRAPNRILVVQLDVNANEAKVFKTHAAHLGLCDNLTDAL